MGLTQLGLVAPERVEQAKLRVLYAGDIDLARAQFAANARLALAPIGSVLGQSGSGATDADVAVIDDGAPGVNAPRVIAELRAVSNTIPIVLLLDPSNENGPATALSLRCDDYTVKHPGWQNRLPVRLQIAIGRHRRSAHVDGVPAASAIQQRLTAAVERAPVCLARVLDDGTVAAMNDAGRNMLALDSPADVLKKPFATFVAEADRPALSAFLETVCSGEARSVELSIVSKGGDVRSAEVRGVGLPQDGNDRPSAIVVIRDVGERRRLEASVLDMSATDAEARATHERLSAEATELRQRLAEAEEQQRRVAEQMARQLEQHQRDAAIGLRESNDALEQERHTREELQRRLDDEEQRLFASVAACDAANGRVVALAGECETANSRVVELTRECDAANGRVAALAHQCEVANSRVAELTRECAELRAAIEQVTTSASADRNTQLRRIDELERATDTSALSAALSEARAARGAAEHRAAELADRVAELQHHADKLALRAGDLEERLAIEAAAAVLERKRADSIDVSGQHALVEHRAGLTAVRHALANAEQERDSLRAALETERQRREASVSHDAHREQLAAVAVLTTRLADAEAACQRAVADRSEHAAALQRVQNELQQFNEIRRGHRQELLAALNDAERFENLAAQRLDQCADLQRRLRAAKADFDELTAWAATRATRIEEGPS